MKRVIIPVLLCLAAMLVVLAAQNARATASMRMASFSARGGIASLKVSVARGKCEIWRAAASEVESPGGQAVRIAAKISTDAIAEFGSALYDDKIPRREVVPVKWTRGCFIDPAESSHVAWDRGKRAASNHLELLDEDSRSPARLSSSGRSRKTVFSALHFALHPESLIDSGATTRLFSFVACISSGPSTQAPCFFGT
jgi:hypothetical protein